MNKKKDSCSERTRTSKIRVGENGKSAVFQNPDRAYYDKTRVDGCMLNNETAADYVVTKEKVGDVIVELKGKDIPHAVEQALATAKLYVDHELRTGKIAALIVAKSYPKFDNAVRKGKEKFAKLYNGPLHVVTKNTEYVFEKVLTQAGPF